MPGGLRVVPRVATAIGDGRAWSCDGCGERREQESLDKANRTFWHELSPPRFRPVWPAAECASGCVLGPLISGNARSGDSVTRRAWREGARRRSSRERHGSFSCTISRIFVRPRAPATSRTDEGRTPFHSATRRQTASLARPSTPGALVHTSSWSLPVRRIRSSCALGCTRTVKRTKGWQLGASPPGRGSASGGPARRAKAGWGRGSRAKSSIPLSRGTTGRQGHGAFRSGLFAGRPAGVLRWQRRKGA